MARIKRYWQFIQETPSTTWEINNVPDGAVDPVITHIKTTAGAILQPDSQLVAPYGLELVFGVTPVIGTAYGEYFEETQNVVVDGYGNSVVINITQTGGAATDEVAKS